MGGIEHLIGDGVKESVRGIGWQILVHFALIECWAGLRLR